MLNVAGTLLILMIVVLITLNEYERMVEDDSAAQVIKAIVEWGKQYLTYAWYLIFALWGAVANYLSAKSRDGSKFSWKELALAMPVAGFSGLCVVYLLEYFGASTAGVAFGSGMAGYMGGRMLLLIESYITRKGEAAK